MMFVPHSAPCGSDLYYIALNQTTNQLFILLGTLPPKGAFVWLFSKVNCSWNILTQETWEELFGVVKYKITTVHFSIAGFTKHCCI